MSGNRKVSGRDESLPYNPHSRELVGRPVLWPPCPLAVAGKLTDCRCRGRRPRRPAEGSRPPPYNINRKRDINGKVAGRACPAPTGCRGKAQQSPSGSASSPHCEEHFWRPAAAKKPPHAVGRWSSEAMTGGALPIAGREKYTLFHRSPKSARISVRASSASVAMRRIRSGVM